MIELVIGVDPDSAAHGVAVYQEGALLRLDILPTVALINYAIFSASNDNNILFSIEDVRSQNFVYSRNNQGSKAAQAKIGRNIGMVQQAQTELMRWLDYHHLRYVLHKPSKHNWAKNKALFERATGWKKRSNEDTRSAAYFGHLAL